jgi:hypothetical protein
MAEAGETIDLGEERRKRHPSPYVDVARILAAASEIDAIADDITTASLERHGCIDVLAHELCAYASAIRRAIT